MKKLILLAALSLTAIAAWAFYPKAAEPGGYIMVVGNSRASGLSFYTS